VLLGLRSRLLALLLPPALALVLGPLLCECTRKIEPRDTKSFDEDLAEAVARALLLFERDVELLLCDQAFLDEQGADQQSRDSWTFHGASIGNPSFEL